MEERTNFMGGKIDIQIKHRNKVLTLRRLDRLIQSDDFTFIWCRISHEEKKAASFLIWLEEYDHFKNWMSKQLDLKFKMYSIRDLRALASKYHIGYYEKNGHLTDGGAEIESLSFLKAAAVCELLELDQKKNKSNIPRVKKGYDKKIYAIVSTLRREPFRDIQLPECIH